MKKHRLLINNMNCMAFCALGWTARARARSRQIQWDFCHICRLIHSSLFNTTRQFCFPLTPFVSPIGLNAVASLHVHSRNVPECMRSDSPSSSSSNVTIMISDLCDLSLVGYNKHVLPGSGSVISCANETAT